MISILLSLALAQVSVDPPVRPSTPHDRHLRENRRLGGRSFAGNSLAFFEAFPASGAGTSGACSTTAPTGAKGEALTFTRASTATCTKTAGGGLATTGIANGDLVSLTNDKARVEYDGAGTLGLLVESARTNSTLRSQELSDAAWLQNVDSAPRNTTVTADVAVAPDGTTTADRLDLIATTGVQFSSRAQLAACPAGSAQGISVYLKSVTTGDTLDICDNATCTSCTHVPGSWTRCTGVAAVALANQYAIGNLSVSNGGVARNAQSVYVWGLQCEAGAYATSYIPTVAAAATRAADDPTFAIPSTNFTAPWSVAGSLSSLGSMTTPRYHGTLGTAGLATYVTDSFGGVADSTQVTPNSYTTGLSVTACGTLAGCRSATYHDGTNFNSCINGTCAAGVARAWTTINSVVAYKPGMHSTANGNVDGVVSRLCIDNTSATRCR